MRIDGYRIRKLTVPCEPAISDSQYEFDEAGVAYLELETTTGETGIGIGGVAADLPGDLLRRRFEPVGERLVETSPFQRVNERRRPRGGQHASEPFQRAVDVALWDCCGKHLDLPLYELLGGTDPAVPTYGSGLAFGHDDERTREVYREFRAEGVDAAKVKVGYPTVEADVERLELVREVLGPDATLLVDANEAWSPKEAVRRVHAYRDAGVDVSLVEDPVLREDVEGFATVSEQVPFAHVNAGEYVNLETKRQYLERRAIDMLNLRGGVFSEALQAATLATVYGLPIHVGDVHCEVGVHLAAALPEVAYVEYWKRPWDLLTDESVRVEDGEMIAPDRPGHGVTIADEALQRYGESATHR